MRFIKFLAFVLFIGLCVTSCGLLKGSSGHQDCPAYGQDKSEKNKINDLILTPYNRDSEV